MRSATKTTSELPVEKASEGPRASAEGPKVAQQPVPDDTEPARGAITRAGFIGHIDTCVRQLAALLSGARDGAENPQHDSALELARVQLWRWLHAGDARLDDGTPINFALFDTAVQRVGERLPRRGMRGQENMLQAACLLAELTHARTLVETVPVAALVSA